MFPALLVLRAKQPDTPRPYRVPGGTAGAWLWVILCEAGVVFAIVAFFWLVPDGTPKATYWGITVGGTLVSIVIGLWLGRGGADTSQVVTPALAEPDAMD
jgi:hypothetical protein